jgi:ubiquinone/menaquinone biosynthesis C-methylase UbiE
MVPPTQPGANVSRVVGLDLDIRAAMKIVSHYSLRNVWLTTANGAILPFRDREFDLVVTTKVLEHIRSLSLGLNEIERILKDDGALLVSVPTENAAYSLALHATGLVRPANYYNNAATVLTAIAKFFAVEWHRYFPLNWKSVGGFMLVAARKQP